MWLQGPVYSYIPWDYVMNELPNKQSWQVSKLPRVVMNDRLLPGVPQTNRHVWKVVGFYLLPHNIYLIQTLLLDNTAMNAHHILHYTVCLNHWGWVTHICVSKLTIIGSDNGLSTRRCQAIIWTNAGILLIGPSGTNFIEIHIFHSRKCILKCHSETGGHFVCTSIC